MAYLDDDRVNSWLAATKYQVQALEPELEEQVVQQGFARLSTRYAIDLWLDEASTPPLVITALSMLYAAWYLERQISDDQLDADSYPIRLEARAWGLIDGIASDTIDLPGVDPDPAILAGRQPLFYPDDSSTALWEDDPTDPNGAPRHFSMGQTF